MKSDTPKTEANPDAVKRRVKPLVSPLRDNVAYEAEKTLLKIQAQSRNEFENIISRDPFGKNIERWGDIKNAAWAGSYKDISTDLAWHLWQAGIEYMANVKGHAPLAESERGQQGKGCSHE